MNTLITLPNGRTAIMFVHEDSTELAIVPLNTLQRLAELLPTAHPKKIINDFISNLDGICCSNSDYLLKDAITAAEDFVSFHRTVNLIAEYKPEPLPDIDRREEMMH